MLLRSQPRTPRLHLQLAIWRHLLGGIRSLWGMIIVEGLVLYNRRASGQCPRPPLQSRAQSTLYFGRLSTPIGGSARPHGQACHLPAPLADFCSLILQRDSKPLHLPLAAQTFPNSSITFKPSNLCPPKSAWVLNEYGPAPRLSLPSFLPPLP
jgi:hypothetical protein